MIKLNDSFRAVTTGQEFFLFRIVERVGQIKLKEPIYQFRYTNRESKDFTCYLDHVKRSVDFGNWIKIRKHESKD